MYLIFPEARDSITFSLGQKRLLVASDQPVAAPPLAREPRPRPTDGPAFFVPSRRPCARRHLPTIEPMGGAARIKPSHALDVLAPVHDDVDDRVSHFPRRSNVARVVPISPESPPSADQPVDTPGHAHRKSTDAACNGNLVVRLDEQVNVVVLHGEVNHAKPCPRRAPDRSPNFEEHDLLPQARRPPARAKRHVCRMPPLVIRPRPMRHPLSPIHPRPTSPLPPPAPIAIQWQRELHAGGRTRRGELRPFRAGGTGATSAHGLSRLADGR